MSKLGEATIEIELLPIILLAPYTSSALDFPIFQRFQFLDW